MRLAIIGSGPGGYVAALKAAQLGAEVTVLEADEVGGVCLNRGCIPTKTLIASAELYDKLKELDSYGIELQGSAVADFGKMMARKNRVVDIQVKGIKALFKSWGVRLVEGRGKMLSPARIEAVGKDGSARIIETDKIIVATGSRPALMPAFPFDGETILSSDDALTIKSIPASLLIIGAGVIGCEFASMFRALGTEITMVEMMDRAVATEDEEISETLEREFKKRKINVLKKIKVDRVERRDDGMHAFTSDGRELVAQKILVSIGRVLNTEGLGLEELGIALGPRGQISVNDKMETNVPGVYAIGDVVGKILLAHVASRQGLVAAVNAMGGSAEMDYSAVPAAVFTTPEIASVGLREFQTREKGLKYRTGQFPYRALGKAHAIGEIAGFIKIIADEATDEILGAHIIGAHASDMIHELVVARAKGLTAREIASVIHIHPTLPEGIMEAAGAVHGEAIHAPKSLI